VLQNADLPLTFLFFQLLMSVLLIYAWGAIKSTSWSSPAWSPAMARKMVPVSAVNVVGLVFNIYCLKLVDASYFQVARGLVLPFTIALQAFIPGGARPTSLTLICCALVTWGFTYSFLPFPVGAGLVPEAPALGMLLGVLSAAMIAMHAVLIKTSLRHVDGSTLDLAYWTNILSLAAITPGVVISGEIARFVRLLAGREGDLRAFAVGSAVTVSTTLLALGFAAGEDIDNRRESSGSSSASRACCPSRSRRPSRTCSPRRHGRCCRPSWACSSSATCSTCES